MYVYIIFSHYSPVIKCCDDVHSQKNTPLSLGSIYHAFPPTRKNEHNHKIIIKKTSNNTIQSPSNRHKCSIRSIKILIKFCRNTKSP